MGEEWISTGEAAERLDVHPETVRRWADEGLLRSKRTMPDGRGHRKISATSVEAYIRKTQPTESE